MLTKIYENLRRKYFPSLEYYLDKLTRNAHSLADLGCGPNSPVRLLPKKKIMLGVDAAEASIEQSKKQNIFTQYLVANILDSGIPEKTFDMAISLDVINLLQKKDGYRLLEEMERIAKKRIIILTPNGKVEEPREIKAQSATRYKSEYKYLKYRSTWTAEEMQRLGFKVIGINGWKILRTRNAQPKIKPTSLGVLISDFTQLITRYYPNKAFHLLCYKDLK